MLRQIEREKKQAHEANWQRNQFVEELENKKDFKRLGFYTGDNSMHQYSKDANYDLLIDGFYEKI